MLENDRIRQFKAKIVNDENTEVFPWERSYYSELLRREKYDFDDEALRPYFPVDKVMKGIFMIASSIYGINVRQAETFYRSSQVSLQLKGKLKSVIKMSNITKFLIKKTNDQLGGFFADWKRRLASFILHFVSFEPEESCNSRR